jgi:hypothetical protein
LAVQAALSARGLPARVVANPAAHPARLSWRLDTDRCVSRLAFGDEPPITDDEIDGVLVRDAGWVDPAGWQPKDLAYVQAETQAALLGWLWGLRCPVVNRYPAATWYRPQLPPLAWHSLLRRCDLPALEAIVTNVGRDARAFGRRTAPAAEAGAVYRPMTSGGQYLVATDGDWDGLAAMQRRAPVCLTAPHGRPQSACVVGGRVVWDGSGPPPDAPALEPALRRFAAAAGLAFVEVVLAEDNGGRRVVVGVEHHPRYECFSGAAQGAIVAALVESFTAPVGAGAREEGAP